MYHLSCFHLESEHIQVLSVINIYHLYDQKWIVAYKKDCLQRLPSLPYQLHCQTLLFFLSYNLNYE